MSRTSQDADLVSPSQIALRVGVDLSTVGNWRRRHPRFPAPAERGPRGDLFTWGAVRQWLISTGRADSIKKPSWRVALADQLRSTGITDTVLSLLCLWSICSKRERPKLAFADGSSLIEIATKNEVALKLRPGLISAALDVNREALELARALVPTIAEPGIADAEPFRFALDLRRTTGGRKSELEHTSHPALTTLMAALTPANVESVLDPACGYGQYLAAVGDTLNGDAVLRGYDISQDVCDTAEQLLVASHLKGTVEHRDSLHDSSANTDMFDLVVCSPPIGQRLDPDSRIATSLAFEFGGARPRVADLAWIVACLNGLTPTGDAFIVTSPNALTRNDRGSQEIRFELLRRGSIRAIAQLPAGLLSHSSLPLVLVALSGSRNASQPGEVLMIDGSDIAVTSSTHGDRHDALVPIAEEYLRWRKKPTAFSPQAGFSTVVPVMELLKPDSSLTPQPWLYAANTADLDSIKDHVEATLTATQVVLNKLRNVPFDSDFDGTEDLESAFVTLATLADSEAIEITRGEKIGIDSLQEEGPVPVLTAASLPKNGILAPVGFLASARDDQLTRPGDVILLPIGPSLRAVVDRRGGHAAAHPLVVITPNPRNPSVEPYLLAAILSSEFVQAQTTGATTRRVDVPRISVPLLPAHQAQVLSAKLEELAEVRRLAAVTARQATLAENALTALVAAQRGDLGL